jgi:hypothetical protein
MGVSHRTLAIAFAAVVAACTAAPPPEPGGITTAAPAPSASASAGNAPVARGYHAIVSMGTQGVLLYGGSTAPPGQGGVSLKDLWIRRGALWTRVPSEGPVSADVVAWDPDTARLFVTPGGDVVWLYDPKADQWERRTVTEGPPALDSARGVYDTRARRVIVTTRGSTWTYDVAANAWKRMASETNPPSLRWYSLTYHRKAGVTVLFGGSNADGTWTYDAVADAWREIRPATAPSGRQYSATAYDEETERVVLFGGTFGPQSAETPLGDTWSYDLAKNEWTQLSPARAPNPRGWHAMTYDAASARIVLFGGGAHRTEFQADTWTFDGSAWERSP